MKSQEEKLELLNRCRAASRREAELTKKIDALCDAAGWNKGHSPAQDTDEYKSLIAERNAVETVCDEARKLWEEAIDRRDEIYSRIDWSNDHTPEAEALKEESCKASEEAEEYAAFARGLSLFEARGQEATADRKEQELQARVLEKTQAAERADLREKEEEARTGKKTRHFPKFADPDYDGID